MIYGCSPFIVVKIYNFQEPTSGLDSSTALSLMKQIKQLSSDNNKMVILTIHQPSSQIYRMFDSLLLLAGGQVRDIMDF